MGHLIGMEYAKEQVLEIAKNIVLATHKAPQITGKTIIETEIIWGEDLEPILEMMEQVARAYRYVQWDYETIRNCYEKGDNPVIINIGAKCNRSELMWDCGACGHDTCKEFNKYSKDQGGGGMLGGPACNWKVLDYAIACDYACASAYQYRVDNRIMGSVGAALTFLNYLPNSDIKLGLALGPPRDMVYYSREEMHKSMTYEMDKSDIIRCIPTHFATFPGGGKPDFKTRDDWWAPPDALKFEMSEETMDLTQEVLYEKIPEIADKYAAQIAARYENTDKKGGK